MATRTAPAVNGTPNVLQVSIRWIDVSGDLRAVSIDADPGATNAEIEALVDNLQTMSNASIYRVEVSQVYNSIPSVASATAGIYPSVFDNVVLLLKTPDNQSTNVFIPAPDATVMSSSSDTPLTAPLLAIAASITNVLEGTGTEDWNLVSARFTERREKNQRVFI